MIVVESHGVVLIVQGNDQMFFGDIDVAVGVFTHVNLFLAGNRPCACGFSQALFDLE